MSQDLVPLFSGGIQKHFNLKYDLYNSVIPDIFHIDDTNSRFVDHVGWEKYRLPQSRDPGMPIAQDVFRPSYGKRYVIVNYGLGDTIAQEDWDDDQYGVISRLLPQKGGALADAFRVLEERVPADMFKNLAFASNSSTSVAGSPDGYSLFNTAHPVASANTAVTYANRPSTEADASISAYQAGATALMQQFAPNNTEIISNKPRAIVANPDQRYVWKQVLKGEWERGTADRNTNFIPDDNVRLIEWPYFRINGSSGTRNAWMMIGQTHFLYFIRRHEVRFKTDYAVNVLAYIFVAYDRFAVGWSDWRGVYGSTGT